MIALVTALQVVLIALFSQYALASDGTLAALAVTSITDILRDLYPEPYALLRDQHAELPGHLRLMLDLLILQPPAIALLTLTALAQRFYLRREARVRA
jgi:hypothetical protein